MEHLSVRHKRLTIVIDEPVRARIILVRCVIGLAAIAQTALIGLCSPIDDTDPCSDSRQCRGRTGHARRRFAHASKTFVRQATWTHHGSGCPGRTRSNGKLPDEVKVTGKGDEIITRRITNRHPPHRAHRWRRHFQPPYAGGRLRSSGLRRARKIHRLTRHGADAAPAETTARARICS